MLAGTEVHLKLANLPAVPHTSNLSTLNPALLWLVVGLLILLAILFVTWFIYRSKRRSPRPATENGVATRSLGETSPLVGARSPAQSPEQQALLQKLLNLDKAFEAGKIKKAEYQEQRAKTKAQLRLLMNETDNKVGAQIVAPNKRREGVTSQSIASKKSHVRNVPKKRKA